MGGGSEGGEGGETTVWAFVSARPFFGQVPGIRQEMQLLVRRSESPRQQLRDYQHASVEMAKEENVIVNLGTGLGKTLIAVRTFDHFARLDRSKLTLFVVPKVAIDEQQRR